MLLVKAGPTENPASAQVQIQNAQGILLTELGYDIRTGSHCAGSPRLSVVTVDNVTHVISCVSPATVTGMSQGWRRLRFDLSQAAPPIVAGSVVQSMTLVLDEGQNASPDFSGEAILDNIDVGGKLLGGPAASAQNQKQDGNGHGYN